MLEDTNSLDGAQVVSHPMLDNIQSGEIPVRYVTKPNQVRSFSLKVYRCSPPNVSTEAVRKTVILT